MIDATPSCPIMIYEIKIAKLLVADLLCFRGKIQDKIISELVNNVWSAISRRTLLLLLVDDP
jgi:hypothetical protein